ncbi:hypothetical protein COCCADRAFT_28567 [Bipolaris zeicola 26-R-13]|uniref:Uncharacterized protein n=1 Tax=Cochliobolus carbonum (strain 26-R-13) TaxID=930089 RepID=W6YGV0_COCC2|nr:uncharacterized protein COCCADRAFT_28567 [Bipolaris zeicola 26-R-13]EUC30551.1 hypothetical protein COCCADRAFT_28567 [Bipolaris zeicola 26-R-13]
MDGQTCDGEAGWHAGAVLHSVPLSQGGGGWPIARGMLVGAFRKECSVASRCKGCDAEHCFMKRMLTVPSTPLALSLGAGELASSGYVLAALLPLGADCRVSVAAIVAIAGSHTISSASLALPDAIGNTAMFHDTVPCLTRHISQEPRRHVGSRTHRVPSRDPSVPTARRHK